MTSNYYSYSLSLTSQFYYCSLPLRLDSYSRCLFNCRYCFANARGGFRHDQAVTSADVRSLDRRLSRLRDESPRSLVDEFLARRQPIHFGGMSDPFHPVEDTRGVTKAILSVLAKYNYPTVLSTKGDIFARDEYIDILRSGSFIVQLSMSSLDDALLRRTDAGTPGPSALLRAARRLAVERIPMSCRIQPLLPTREGDAFEVIDACRELGIRHVAAEHLKLPVEHGWLGTSLLSSLLGVDLVAMYKARGARRVGREWVLPVEDRLDRVLALRERAHARGLTFGAADNDLMLLSDGDACCSGVDFHDDFTHIYRCTYPEAARSGVSGHGIRLSVLDSRWSPVGSPNRYINSHSRLGGSDGHKPGVRSYIEHNWNGSPNGNSPRALYGVVDSGELDDHGYHIYDLSREIRTLMETRIARGIGVGSSVPGASDTND